MDFVEAVRLGCEQTHPRVGRTYDFDGNGRAYACVLGAAGLGYGFSAEQIRSTLATIRGLAEVSPQVAAMRETSAACPIKSCTVLGLSKPMSDFPERMDSIVDVAVHLNDTHRWSRIRIAEWAQMTLAGAR